METSLNDLPSTILFMVFKHLQVEDIICSTKASKLWNKAITNNRLWKNLYSYFYLNLPDNIDDWKTFFSKRYLCKRNMLNGECTLSRFKKKILPKKIL
jgi:hypothetical protein